MKEIALTMEGVGLIPNAFDGAAAMYELVDRVFHQKGYSEGPPILEVLSRSTTTSMTTTNSRRWARSTLFVGHTSPELSWWSSNAGAGEVDYHMDQSTMPSRYERLWCRFRKLGKPSTLFLRLGKLGKDRLSYRLSCGAP